VTSLSFDVEADKGYAFRAFVGLYTSLSDHEVDLHRTLKPIPAPKDDCFRRCIEIADLIQDYIHRSMVAYVGNAYEMSTAILLVMELWRELDQCAVKAFPLLKEFNPGLPVDLLDVLRLPYKTDMIRLQMVQGYLQNRHAMCGVTALTIFDDPTNDCFATRYFDRSPILQQIQQTIEADAEQRRQEKTLERDQVKSEYDELLKEMAEMDCTTTKSSTWPYDARHNEKRCAKCVKDKRSRCKRIEPFEHPLPRRDYDSKAAIFELNIPAGFSSYRDATWMIISQMGRAEMPGEVAPQLFLSDYLGTKPYQRSARSKFRLASRVKTSAQTHRSTVHVSRDLDQFFVNCSLQLAYFDSHNGYNNWVATTRLQPTFAQHCKLTIPNNSPFATLLNQPDFANHSTRPSSNAVLSSEPDCPNNLNVHEYLAIQGLFSPAYCRWPLIVSQLGSSSLNFSNEATSSLIQHLSCEVGPVNADDIACPFRAAHMALLDDVLCYQLIDQVKSRLATLALNWRESHSMAMIVALLTRLYSLASPTIAEQALRLIEDVRQVLCVWNELLYEEIRNARNEQTAQSCSMYAFEAALLGRRTFSVFMENHEGVYDPSGLLDAKALLSFISFSITLQNNCPSPQKLSNSLKTALVRDIKLVYSLRSLLCESLEQNPQCLSQALDAVWPDSGRICSSISFLPFPHDHWAQMLITSPFMRAQTVHFHIIEGHLRIENQALGRLSENFRKAAIIQDLFNDLNLHVYPSALPGMTHVLTVVQNGWKVHVGSRNGHTIVRALKDRTLLELVPRDIFEDSFGNFDLPQALVEDCVHWLDLHTNMLEVRRKANMWRSVDSHWCLNLQTRTAHRRQSRLVDPQSDLFKKFAKIFQGFELPEHLTVYYPQYGPISVELRRLDLRFNVGFNDGMLESPQMKMEIDPNQDSGCFYGLRSTLVLRDKANWFNRSVLVPMGQVNCRRLGVHVSIRIQPSGTYLKYNINESLGRINCPMESAILYQLIVMHAVTSFVVEDPLTNRTGSEQALYLLTSAQAQPHVPLPASALPFLRTIAALAPTREFYPLDLRKMQKVTWNAFLTTTIQREEFLPLVQVIKDASNMLSLFDSKKSSSPASDPCGG
jgi:hypothetical protein